MLTPALVIYPHLVRHNVQQMVAVIGGDPGRWRPHLKTVKLLSMMRLLVDAGITSAKCATTLELLTACQAGMRDVLVAYPHTGSNAKRVAAIAAAFPRVRVSAIVEASEQLRNWTGSGVDLFIDINTGMNRTGIAGECLDEIAGLARQIAAARLTFRGLHFYDGHATEPDLGQRTEHAHARYDRLLGIISALESSGIPIGEVISSGTPGFPCTLSYPRLWEGKFVHQVSPGTVVYSDATSLEQLPEEYGFQSAALVISRVVSHPKAGVVTCDAGHKSVSVDSGVPNCIVLGAPELTAMKPSEEHLPLSFSGTRSAPPIGELLYLIPRHICPTVNNFDFAAIAEGGRLTSIQPVSARGHEGPLATDLPLDRAYSLPG